MMQLRYPALAGGQFRSRGSQKGGRDPFREGPARAAKAQAGHIIAIPNITRKCVGGKVKSTTETEVKGNIQEIIEVAEVRS